MFYQTLKFNLNERNDWLQNNTANQTNPIPIHVNNHGLNKLFNMRSDSYRDFIDEYASRVTYLPVFFGMESDGVRTISDVLKVVKHDTDNGLTIAIDDLIYLGDVVYYANDNGRYHHNYTPEYNQAMTCQLYAGLHRENASVQQYFVTYKDKIIAYYIDRKEKTTHIDPTSIRIGTRMYRFIGCDTDSLSQLVVATTNKTISNDEQPFHFELAMCNHENQIWFEYYYQPNNDVYGHIGRRRAGSTYDLGIMDNVKLFREIFRNGWLINRLVEFAPKSKLDEVDRKYRGFVPYIYPDYYIENILNVTNDEFNIRYYLVDATDLENGAKYYPLEVLRGGYIESKNIVDVLEDTIEFNIQIKRDDMKNQSGLRLVMKDAPEHLRALFKDIDQTYITRVIPRKRTFHGFTTDFVPVKLDKAENEQEVNIHEAIG